jgi:hypothetical protein
MHAEFIGEAIEITRSYVNLLQSHNIRSRPTDDFGNTLRQTPAI